MRHVAYCESLTRKWRVFGLSKKAVHPSVTSARVARPMDVLAPAEVTTALPLPPPDVWAGMDLVSLLEQTGELLPGEDGLPMFDPPSPCDWKRGAPSPVAAQATKLQRTATAVAAPVAEATSSLDEAGPLCTAALPVGPDEQALLSELSSVLGSTSTKDSLRMALELLRPQPAAAAARNDTPPGGTPPSSPEDTADDQKQAGGGGAAAATAAAAKAPTPPSSTATAQPGRNQIDYPRFMDSQGFGVMMMDMGGNFIQWNSTLQNLLGYSQPEMEKLSMMHLTPAEDLPAMMEMMPRMMEVSQQPTIAAPMVRPSCARMASVAACFLNCRSFGWLWC